jgi:hypothetical protein
MPNRSAAMNASPFLATLWLFFALSLMIIPSISETLPVTDASRPIADRLI